MTGFSIKGFLGAFMRKTLKAPRVKVPKYLNPEVLAQAPYSKRFFGT